MTVCRLLPNVPLFVSAVCHRTLTVLGRSLHLPKTCGRVLDSTFQALCMEVSETLVVSTSDIMHVQIVVSYFDVKIVLQI